MRKLRQIESVTVHCAICFNQGKQVPAFSIVKGYAVCADHVKLVSKPKFDIFDLQAHPNPA